MASSAVNQRGDKPKYQRVRFDPQTPSPPPPRKTRPATPHPDAGLRVTASPDSAQAATTSPPRNVQPAPASTKTATAPRPTVQPVNTYTNPAFGVNPTFTHLTTTGAGAAIGSPFPQPVHANPGFQAQPLVVSYGAPPVYVTTTNLADYQNAAPPNAGVNFQPQVPDTTQGPFVGTYTPRQDAAYPGAIYVQPGQPVFQVSLNHQQCCHSLQTAQPVITGFAVLRPYIHRVAAF